MSQYMINQLLKQNLNVEAEKNLKTQKLVRKNTRPYNTEKINSIVLS